MSLNILLTNVIKINNSTKSKLNSFELSWQTTYTSYSWFKLNIYIYRNCHLSLKLILKLPLASKGVKYLSLTLFKQIFYNYPSNGVPYYYPHIEYLKGGMRNKRKQLSASLWWFLEITYLSVNSIQNKCWLSILEIVRLRKYIVFPLNISLI